MLCLAVGIADEMYILLCEANCAGGAYGCNGSKDEKTIV